MAYRTFRSEKHYEAPDIDFLPRTLAVLHTIQQNKQRQQLQKLNALAQYKADAYEGKFITDQEDLNMLAKEITEEANRDIMATGYISPATRQRQSRALSYQNLSQSQRTVFEDLQKAIQDRKISNKYYMPQVDQDALVNAAYGTNERINFFKRGERLQEVGQTIGKDYLRTFDKDAFLSDYVAVQKTQTKESDVTTAAGIQSGKKIEAAFWNKYGVPEVTDEHAIRMLDSSPDIKTRYDQELFQQLAREADQMKASKEAPWMEGLTRDQVITELINNPAKNTINSTPFGIREREMAKADLKEKERQNIKTSYDAGDASSGAKWGITSKTINSSDGFNPKSFSGPSRTITRTNSTANPYLTYQSVAPLRYDLDTGEITENQLPRQFKLMSYQWGAVDPGGKPVNIEASNTDEYINKLNALPTGAVANAKILLRGQSIDSDVLDMAYTKRDQLEDDILNNPDDDVKKGILNKLNETLANIEADQGFNSQFLQKLLNIKILHNELVPTAPGDENARFIESQSGMNIYSEKAQNPEMKKVRDAIERKAKEDYKTQYKDAKVGVGARKEAKTPSGKPLITSDGTDVEGWTVDKDYKVGENTYFYDSVAKEWKKR